MNKWFILVATAFLVLGAGYTLPIAFKNPSASNLLISGIITAFAVLGIVMYYLKIRTKSVKLEGLTPVQE